MGFLPLKSILLITHILMPVIATIVQSIKATAPRTPLGIEPTIALNFAKNPNKIANIAAKSMTNGE